MSEAKWVNLVECFADLPDPRVVGRTDHDLLDIVTLALCPAVTGRVIAIDGKALRGSGSVGRGQRALHLVSACAAEYGLTLGQRACEEKSNEITAIQELLPVLALGRAVVTIDAMGCQTAIAGQIKEAKGHRRYRLPDLRHHCHGLRGEVEPDTDRVGVCHG